MRPTNAECDVVVSVDVEPATIASGKEFHIAPHGAKRLSQVVGCDVGELLKLEVRLWSSSCVA